ncbi:hypothetical protein BH18THE2_BH18THE2_30360 [soil metagenome]
MGDRRPIAVEIALHKATRINIEEANDALTLPIYFYHKSVCYGMDYSVILKRIDVKWI